MACGKRGRGLGLGWGREELAPDGSHLHQDSIFSFSVHPILFLSLNLCQLHSWRRPELLGAIGRSE